MFESDILCVTRGQDKCHVFHCCWASRNIFWALLETQGGRYPMVLVRHALWSSPVAASDCSPQAHPNGPIWWTLQDCSKRWIVWPKQTRSLGWTQDSCFWGALLSGWNIRTLWSALSQSSPFQATLKRPFPYYYWYFTGQLSTILLIISILSCMPLYLHGLCFLWSYM